MLDIIGNKYDYLTVIEFSGFIISGKDTAKRKYKKRIYNCSCICGKIISVRRDCLISGNTKSCGCMSNKMSALKRFKDYKDCIFGKLTVIEHIEKVGAHQIWKCQCECGNIVNVRANNLKSGSTTSCGCAFKEAVTIHGMSRKPGYTNYLMKDPIRKLKRYTANRIRKIFKSKNIVKGGCVFNYLPYTGEQLKTHLEDLWEPWMNWDNYGGNLNDPRKTWHIDHIIPQCKFIFTSMNDKEFLECWSLANLRPLEKIENNIKRCN